MAENQFYVLEDDGLYYLKNRTVEAALNNGLPAGGKNHLFVCAGISAGTAMVSFDLPPTPLDRDQSQQWEDAIELDYTSTLRIAHPPACMGPDEDSDDMDAYEVTLAFNGLGTYRVRLHARGRHVDPDGVQENDEPIAEYYLIQVWPTS